MARVTLDVERMTRSGLVATYTNANVDGHAFKPGKGTFLHVKQGTGARVVTIPISRTVDGQAVDPKQVTVAQGTEPYIGPFTDDYVQPDGLVYVNYDATTNTTVAVVEVPV